MNAEMVAFVRTTGLQIQEAGGAAALGIESLYPLFSELSLKLEQVHQTVAGNPLTAVKEKAEYYRDNRYGALTAFVRNALYDSNPEIAEAADEIMVVIDSAGNPVNLGDSKETAELQKLFARLSPLAPQIERIGATARLKELEDANLEFERRQNEWFGAGGRKSAGSVRAVRKQWTPVYKSIIYRINSLAEVNGAAQYLTFADAHNKTTAYYHNIIAQRTGRKKNDNSEKQNDK
jgi:hypothetical protein